MTARPEKNEWTGSALTAGALGRRAARGVQRRFGGAWRALVACAAVMLAGAAFAAKQVVDGIEWTYQEVGSSEAKIYAGSMTPAISPDTAGSITVPATLGGRTVTRIGEWAFYGCKKLTNVTMLLGLTAIEANAFFDCSIEKVEIASGVTSIGANAFFRTALESVWTPSSVTDIGTAAFASCSSLRRVEMTGIPASIPAQLFSGCTALESLTIPDSVTAIEAQAFKDCTALKEIALPDGVTSIDGSAFAGSALEVVYVSEGKTDAVKTAGLVPEAGGFKIVELGSGTTCSEAGFTWTYRTVGEADGVKEVEILSGIYPSPTGSFAVPATLDGLTVTRIGDSAFCYCTTLTGVTLPDTLTHIGDNAFGGCSLLSDVNIPDGVTCLGGSAFYDCDALTSIEIPGSVTSIGPSAFNECNALVSVVIGDGAKRIGDGAFCYCGALKSVTIPGSVTAIGASAFSGCGVLESIEIPAGVTAIGDQAFKECDALTSVAIPDGVTKVGDEAFYGCDALESVEMGIGVTRIGQGAFASCPLLKSAQIPGGVTLIGDAAFSFCYALESVAIPDSVTHMGTDAFDSTTALTTVYVSTGKGEDVKSLLFASGRDTTGISFVERFAVTFNANGGDPELVSRLAADGTVGKLPTPGRDGYTFRGWFTAGLGGEQVMSPDTAVTEDVTYYAHWLKNGYATEIVDGIEWTYRIVDGKAEIGNDGAVAILDTTEGAIAIPATLGGKPVTSIGDGAFSSCTKLTGVTIPDGVTNIGDGAFYFCSMLTDMTIPDSVTNVGNYAFNFCSGLTDVTIGNGVTSIGIATFSGCHGLTGVTIPAAVTSIGNSAFSYCSGLEGISIPDGVAGIGSDTFMGCAALADVTIGNGVTSIDSSAFSGCTGVKRVTASPYLCSAADLTAAAFPDATATITDIVFPDDVASVADNAFRGLTAVTTVTLSAGVCENVSLEKVFPDSYDAITAVAFGGGVKALGVDLFYGCSGLADVTIPEGVSNIGDFAFKGCAGLTSVTIPSSVTNIGDSAFSDCSGLVTLSIPEGVTSIGSYVFSGCTSLDTISIPDSMSNIGYAAFEYCNAALYDTMTIPGVTLVDGWAVASDASISGAVDLTGVRGIASGVFAGRAEITAVKIPDGVTSICAEAFADCTGLTEVTIPDSVTSIGTYAFGGCDKLKKATVPVALKDTLDPTVFQNCPTDLETVFHAIFTVTFNPNGGTVAETSRMVDSNFPEIGELPTPIWAGYDFDGWYTAASGGYLVSTSTVVSADETYYAYWHPKTVAITFDANGGDGGYGKDMSFGESLVPPDLTWEGHVFERWEPAVPPTVPAEDMTYVAQWTLKQVKVTFDANGGEGGKIETLDYGTPLTPPTVAREGYVFSGWSPEVPSAVPAEDAIYTAQWTFDDGGDSGAGGEGGGGSGGGHSTSDPGDPEPGTQCHVVLDASEIVEPYLVPKAMTLQGVVYDGCDVVGIVELKLAKVNTKKKTGKVSGSFIGLDGKKLVIKSTSVTGIDGTAPASVSLAVKNHGTMTVTIGGTKFAGSLGGWHVQSADVGGNWTTATATVTVETGDLSVFAGMVLSGLLPTNEVAAVTRGKWVFAKAAGVKWAKPKKDADPPEINDAESGKGLIVDDTKNKTNLSGLKLTYTPKKGTFKGTFKVYALEGSGKATKLKKYTVNVTGVVADGVGHGTAICKKPAVSWPVTVK